MKIKNWGIKLCLSLCIFICVTNSYAQSNIRSGERQLDALICKIDTLSIIPETFVIEGIPKESYRLNCLTSELLIIDSTLIGNTIHYSYRVFSLDLSKKISHKSKDIILTKFVADPTAQTLYTLASASNEPLFDSSLQGNGSIARGISIGNNQDFALDAHLNLQLAGKLSPDVEIIANITDENLPVQPEGNTRVLKDFNKIFIQLKYKDILKVTAGDIELSAPNDSYFMKVNRQFLGINLAANYKINAYNKAENVVGGGVSKGKYARNTLVPQLGVQGPYRLYGAQNETTIVIIAGSERVYLDGTPLVRGQSNDYTIDYNTGEITFTPKRLIAPENRIVVEFEYSDRYYSRFNVYTYNEFEHEKNAKLKLNVNFFHEQDLKNHSLQPELSDDQMLFLSQIGDNSAAAIYSTAVATSDFASGDVLYQRIDTVIEATTFHNVYVYAGNSRNNVYRVNFSYVGTHKGNYILSKSGVNGKVYEWVAPINGTLQGDYEPIMQLNMPQMTDLLTLGMTYALHEKLLVKTEWSMSYLDQNLFSKQNDSDNAGMAYQLHLLYNTKVHPKIESDLWKYQLQIDYEYLHKNFHTIESHRNVEFARDYNLTNDYGSGTGEQLLKLTTGFTHPTNGKTLYTINWLTHFTQLHAIRNELNSNHHFGAWSWNSQSSYLFSQDTLNRTQFIRTQNDIFRNCAKIVLGVKEDLEYNVFRAPTSDSLRANSYAFNEAMLYLHNSDFTKVKYSFSIKNRIDNELYNNILSTNKIANEAQASVEITHWKHHRLKGIATYRNDIIRDSLRNFSPEHNFIGSLDYAGNFLKGAITLNIYYEAGSGLEQKKNYTYLKVATGQGTHIWNDYNGNGIEEIDEFEVAAFQNEADYVKVWLSTNDYIATYNCGLTQSLVLRPANLWQNKKGFLHFLSMWSNHTTIRTYQKNTLQNSIRSFNPFQFNIADSVLVNQTMNVKNNLAFALPNQYFSAEYLYLKNQLKNLLYYGFESSDLSMHQLSLRSVPIPLCVLQMIYSRSMKSNDSQYFGTRSYQILSHQLQQIVTLRFKNNITTALSFEMIYRKNVVGLEKSNQYNLTYDFDYRMKERGNVTLKLQYSNILYNNEITNSLSYEMLAGLTPGHNFIWNIAYQTRLFEYLQLNLQYEGRVTSDKQLIHTGFLQMKAFF